MNATTARTVGVVTVARSDYGVYRPLLRAIDACADLRLVLYVSGMHLSPEFGMTVREVERDGYEIAARVEMLVSGDSPAAIAASMGAGTLGFAQAFAQRRPDILFVLGDRFEMHAAVTAAVPFLLPVAHFGGGAVTRGAIDDGLRHSITKLSHLHFVETDEHARRVVQMGEAPQRVTVSGALGLDNLRHVQWHSLDDINRHFDLRIDEPPLLVTFHPVTREYAAAGEQFGELLAALEEVELPVVFTYPNADTNGRLLIGMLEEFVQRRPRTWAVASLGIDAWFSLMRQARAMVGNSSSGIIEAASFALPVVNVGSRQQGRLAPENVLCAGPTRSEIKAAIRQAVSDDFRRSLEGLRNPYGDGNAAERIVDVLQRVSLDEALLKKEFYDVGRNERSAVPA